MTKTKHAAKQARGAKLPQAAVEWENLGISNDFLFSKVMQDADLCRELLCRIFPGMKIHHIEYPIVQKSIHPDADAKSVRLRAFLDYVGGRNTGDSFVQRLDEAVKKARKNREWRHEYMTLLMRDQENVEKGIAIGEAKLILTLHKKGYTEAQIADMTEHPIHEVTEIIRHPKRFLA